MQILVIEDEIKLAKTLESGLSDQGFIIDLAATGEDGFYLAASKKYDLIILDIMLPKTNGFDVLAQLRGQDNHTPVIILSARDTVDDRVMGLELGADDYLIKPFAFAELLARCRAIFRRGTKEQDQVKLEIGDLKINYLTREVSRNTLSVLLTPREYDLLKYLAQHQGAVVTRDMIARDVWHQTNRATPLDNVIDVHIGHLRQKIDAPFKDRQLIKTVRGVGFILCSNHPSDSISYEKP